jgi:MFS family permease
MTIGLVLLVTLVAFEALAVNTALPAASDELGGLGLYGWVFSAFMLSTVASIAVSGRAIDQRGLYPVLAVGAPLFCLGLAIGASAPSMLVLVGGRIVQGLGAGAVSSVANVSIGRAYPPQLRGAMLAVMSSSWVVPGLVGPGLSAVVTTSLGWRWVFAGLIPIVALAALLTLPALRPFGPLLAAREADDQRRSADPLLVAIGFAFVIGGLSNAHDLWPLALAAVGLTIAGPALARLSPAGTFRLRRGPAAAIAMNGLISCALFAVDAFVPLAVTDVRHRSVGFAGLALTTGALSWTAGAWVTARLDARISVQSRVRFGFVCVGAGIAMVLLGLRSDVPIVIFPLAWLVAGLGMGLGYQGLALVVLGGGDSEVDDGGPPAKTVAARQMFDTLGNAIGTGVAGASVAIVAAGRHHTKLGLTIAFVTMIVVAMVGVATSGRAGQIAAPVGAPPAVLP